MRDVQQIKTKYAMILRERAKYANQSVEEYCRGKGINPCTYYYWKKRLGATAASAVQNKFLSVQVMQPTPSGDNGEAVIQYEIAFPNGITMRLSGALRHMDHSAIISAVGGLRP